MHHTTELPRRTRGRDENPQSADNGIADTWKQVARDVASVENDPGLWSIRFEEILRDFRFVPASLILAGAASGRPVTLFSRFAIGTIEDSVPGIFEALKEAALTMQQGGTIGCDFSTLSPHGARAAESGCIASGPVSFMKVWDATCATLQSTAARGATMMATLRCDHPDIEAFIDAKRAARPLTHFNLSVLITDAFMDAVKHDLQWPLVFPEPPTAHPSEDHPAFLKRHWGGSDKPVSCRVWRILRARKLLDRLCESAYACAEPGVVFIDRINRENNLGYCETLSATDPLPPHGACNLGSLNVAAYVLDPFTPQARLDDDSLRASARVAVRFLDNVIDLSRLPLALQHEQVRRTRRLGLGITGLADALVMLGLRYDSDTARLVATDLLRGIRNAAYEESVALATEKGSFPALRTEQYLRQPFIARLPEDIRAAIRTRGIRNSHLLAIAPAESINAHGVTSHDHLLMQAALQPCVDGSIANTVALPAHFPKQDVSGIFQNAYDLQLERCTVWREGIGHETD